MERQEGYYWVKLNRDSKHEIGRYNSEFRYWSLTGTDGFWKTTDFEHINENRIKQPGELPD